MSVLASLAGAALAGAAPVFEWDDVYDGGVRQTDVGLLATTDPDGNLVIVGSSDDGLGGLDMMVRKLARETGDTLWTRRVSSGDENEMAPAGIVWDGHGDLLLGGTRLGCYG
jgi:hypothetical protein